MSDYIDISFLGDKDLQRKLNRLAIQSQRKVVRPAMRKSMRPVLKSAQALVPVESGRLRDSLHQKQRTIKGITRAYVATGTREALGIAADEKGFYPAVIEYGSRNHPERSYLRRALHENKNSVLNDLSDHIARGIEREAKK